MENIGRGTYSEGGQYVDKETNQKKTLLVDIGRKLFWVFLQVKHQKVIKIINQR